MTHFFSIPTFWRQADLLKTVFFTIGAFALAVGMWWSLFIAPIDYQQEHCARIMYIHVPAAWMALGIYSLMALLSAVDFIWKMPFFNVMAKTAAPMGFVFTAMTLVTGAIWGKPMWGTWWVWDARLTSMLVLLFLYAGYMLLIETHEDPARGARAGGLLLMVGAINIPIIKFSVQWWHTLHQPASLIKLTGPAIHISMLVPLLIMIGAYSFLFMGLWVMRIESELIQRRIRALEAFKRQTLDHQSREPLRQAC